MTIKSRIAIGFLAALFVIVFSAVLFHPTHLQMALLVTSLIPIFGALFTNYTWPNSGTTPPTSAQMSMPGGSNTLIVATISMLDADTSGVFTHNMNLGTGVDLPANFPLVRITGQSYESTFMPGITVTNPGTSPNAFTIGKDAGTGTGFTATIVVERPHTLVR